MGTGRRNIRTDSNPDCCAADSNPVTDTYAHTNAHTNANIAAHTDTNSDDRANTNPDAIAETFVVPLHPYPPVMPIR